MYISTYTYNFICIHVYIIICTHVYICTHSKFQATCCILRPASVASAGSSAVTSFARFKNHCCKFPSLMFRVRICSPEKKCASSVTRCAHSARALAHLSSFALRVREKESVCVCVRERDRKNERDLG